MFFCRCDGDTIGRARDLTMRVVMCFVMIVKYCANKITTRRVLRRDLVGMEPVLQGGLLNYFVTLSFNPSSLYTCSR